MPHKAIVARVAVIIPIVSMIQNLKLKLHYSNQSFNPHVKYNYLIQGRSGRTAY